MIWSECFLIDGESSAVDRLGSCIIAFGLQKRRQMAEAWCKFCDAPAL